MSSTMPALLVNGELVGYYNPNSSNIAFNNTGTDLSSENMQDAVVEINTKVNESKCLVVTQSNISSLPVTVQNASITSTMICIGSSLSTPTAQTGDWTITTSNGSLTISGTISGTTDLTMYLIESR